ncbi:MAG: protease modulator HflC [Deltaproteobacteria bacterium]
MKSTIIALIALAVIGIAILGGAFFIVDETQQVVITQFGKPVGSPITSAGLHVKVPFLQKANYFDKRFLSWDGEPNQIPTQDKRFIWVDTYARWRISDPLLFFQRLRDEQRAITRLDDILDGETRNVIAKYPLIEIVRSSDIAIAQAAGDPEGIRSQEAMTSITQGRERLSRQVLEAGSARVADLGIELLDFQFKRITYVEEVRKEVYARMISERQRIAEQYRSEGAGEAARIAGEREREYRLITSDAYRKAQEIRGAADAEAANIYAAAYGKDPDFYAFYRSLDAYERSIGEKTTLVLSTDSDFLRFLKKEKTR